MPRYLIKRPTWISHTGKLAREGETVDITWPKGTEPKTLGDNMELVTGKAAKAAPEEGASTEQSRA